MRVKRGEAVCSTCGQPTELWYREDASMNALYPRAKDRAMIVHKFKRNAACYWLTTGWVVV